MEPLTGGSLKAPPRPADVVARTPLELSSGLAALAAAHVVHADIKPENIMLRTPGGELVLTDYGVSRSARGGVHEALSTSGGMAGGTMIYFAPELLDDKYASTFASDVCVQGEAACLKGFCHCPSPVLAAQLCAGHDSLVLLLWAHTCVG